MKIFNEKIRLALIGLLLMSFSFSQDCDDNMLMYDCDGLWFCNNEPDFGFDITTFESIIVSSDKGSKGRNFNEPESAALLGDAAAAIYLEKSYPSISLLATISKLYFWFKNCP